MKRIDNIDLTLFKTVHSQTSDKDRTALLAVQRAVANRFGKYSYIEVGSHLGGTIQPHIVDERCNGIYSIDPRPEICADDRVSGKSEYIDNSSERMLRLLSEVEGGDVSKITCLNSDAREVGANDIPCLPELVFIDGEHTKEAALSDFNSTRALADKGATILFHDFSVVYLGIMEVCRLLKKEGVPHHAIKLGGSVFGVFFDLDLPKADPYLSKALRKNRLVLLCWKIEKWFKLTIRNPIRDRLRGKSK
jgi:hypothetical protein